MQWSFINLKIGLIIFKLESEINVWESNTEVQLSKDTFHERLLNNLCNHLGDHTMCPHYALHFFPYLLFVCLASIQCGALLSHTILDFVCV